MCVPGLPTKSLLLFYGVLEVAQEKISMHSPPLKLNTFLNNQPGQEGAWTALHPAYSGKSPTHHICIMKGGDARKSKEYCDTKRFLTGQMS